MLIAICGDRRRLRVEWGDRVSRGEAGGEGGVGSRRVGVGLGEPLI